jgi:hypothetical protein
MAAMPRLIFLLKSVELSMTDSAGCDAQAAPVCIWYIHTSLHDKQGRVRSLAL